MSLQNFINVHHDELVALARSKVAKRNPSTPAADVSAHGVHIFLRQLEGALEDDRRRDPAQRAEPPTDPDIVVTAGLNGLELLARGTSVYEVVHQYGDVCQAVTEVAVKLEASISVADFRTLNRCLDNAIAAAVTSWTEAPRSSSTERTTDLSLQELVDRALLIYSMLHEGKIGTSGPSVAMLGRQLSQMRELLGGGPRALVKG